MPDTAQLTYRQLDQDSDRIACGLAESGIGAWGPGPPSWSGPASTSLPSLSRCSRPRVVPVLIDPGIGLKSLGRCLAEAAPEVFIGIPRAVWARRILGWGKESVRRVIVVGPGRLLDRPHDARRPSPAGAAGLRRGPRRDAVLPPDPPGRHGGDPVHERVTGPPKGAVYTHAIFQGQVDRFRDLYGIEPGEIDLCTFPLFALFAPALGMTAIVPDMDPTRPARVDPESCSGRSRISARRTCSGRRPCSAGSARHSVPGA